MQKPFTVDKQSSTNPQVIHERIRRVSEFALDGTIWLGGLTAAEERDIKPGAGSVWVRVETSELCFRFGDPREAETLFKVAGTIE